MLEFDKKSNLLMTNRYQYSLQDVAEPNLYRELYDYESIPRLHSTCAMCRKTCRTKSG